MTGTYKARVRAFVLGLLMFVLVAFASGCVGNGAASSASPAAGTAAIIQGVAIAEEEVTAYIDTFRKGVQCTDAQAWAEYLANQGTTAQSVREATIYELAAPVVVKAKADELGITVDDNAVDAEINTMRKSLLVADDESWRAELERYGMTEDKLRESVSRRNLEEQVLAKVTSDVTPTDEDLQHYAAESLAGVTAKKVACVYGTNYDNVQAALASIKQAPSVAEGMAQMREHSADLGVNYADVGWDIDAELTSNMRNAIANLQKGQVADAPLSEGGIYYLFSIEDDCAFPADGSAVDFSDGSLKQAVADLASAALKQAAGAAWLQQQIREGITIFEMPSGLSYDIAPASSMTAPSSASASGSVSKAA